MQSSQSSSPAVPLRGAATDGGAVGEGREELSLERERERSGYACGLERRREGETTTMRINGT
tara:strand:+ start:328 stop:513 length:186 start_codon:yes stop_codon:yes gene_type:complete